MAILYEVSAKTGTYTDREGNEKGRYVKMGVVMESRSGGMMLKIESVPTNWDGWAYLNEPRAKEERAESGEPKKGRASENRGGRRADFGDDIPF